MIPFLSFNKLIVIKAYQNIRLISLSEDSVLETSEALLNISMDRSHFLL